MGTFLAKIGTIKDRNGMDLTEAEEMKKTWQEYTEEQYKKIFMTQIIMMVIIYLEPDILECEVKWALGSITTNKASVGDRIPVELFQILKDDAVKVPPNTPPNLENSAMVFLSGKLRTGKGQFSFQSQRKAISKNVQTTAQLHSSHMLIK